MIWGTFIQDDSFVSVYKKMLIGEKLYVYCLGILSIGLCCLNSFRNIHNDFGILFCFIFGHLLSSTLHEWLHIKCMRIFGAEKILVDKTLFKISVITETPLIGWRLIVTAVSGPVICGAFGFLILLVPIGNSIWVDLCGVLFCSHIINLLPFFGDGKMIIKGILTI